MNIVPLVLIVLGLIAGVICKPVSDKDCNRKGKYYQVDCAEQLQFVNPKATCFMNDNGDFMIMTMDKSKGATSPPDGINELWTENPLESKAESDEVEAEEEGTPVDTKREQQIAEAKKKKEAEDTAAVILLGILALAIAG